MVSCRRAAELTSRSLDRPLSLSQRLRLWLHTRTCGGCRRYRQQLGRLHALLSRLLPAATPAGPGLTPDARERLRTVVENAS